MWNLLDKKEYTGVGWSIEDMRITVNVVL